MTDPTIEHPTAAEPPRFFRAALWVAIGAIIAAAIICVIWVLIGSDNDIIGRAFLTVLLLAGFGGIAILESRLADSRPPWFALVSMLSWVAILLLGAVVIWLPDPGWTLGWGMLRWIHFLLIVLVIQLAVLHLRLFTKAHERYTTTFTTILMYVTVVLVWALVVMLVLPLVLFDYVRFQPVYWRVVVALAILAAVGTALLPLVNALFAPKRPQAPRAPRASTFAAPAAAPWPTYADGFTPLPVLPDGTPDWNAYYTGRPTFAQPAPAPAAPAHAPQASAPRQPHAPQQPPAPGYEGYPPPPPLPPR